MPAGLLMACLGMAAIADCLSEKAAVGCSVGDLQQQPLEALKPGWTEECWGYLVGRQRGSAGPELQPT